MFINYLDLDIAGAAIATNITYLTNMFCADLIISTSRVFKHTYSLSQFCDRTVLLDWGTYLRIGIPGALMVCFEWWAFELFAIFSGYMSIEALAAEVVIGNIIAFIFMLPLGISYASSSLTGNFIGSN